MRGLGPSKLRAAGAYAVQALNPRHWVEIARCIVGWKIGLTAVPLTLVQNAEEPNRRHARDSYAGQLGETTRKSQIWRWPNAQQ